MAQSLVEIYAERGFLNRSNIGQVAAMAAMGVFTKVLLFKDELFSRKFRLIGQEGG